MTAIEQAPWITDVLETLKSTPARIQQKTFTNKIHSIALESSSEAINFTRREGTLKV
jgi:hypothetical protein